MALVAYARTKLFWGAVDITHADEAPYTAAQTFPMGANALPPGIGVRRAQIVFSRSTYAPPQDAVTTHIDFQNFTGGSPDDTWTDADFSTLEQLIGTYLGTVNQFMHNKLVNSELRWYRVGPGIVPPNPAVRIHPSNTVGLAPSSLPHQVAATVTLRTVPRRQWGRMYLPLTGVTTLTGDGRFSLASVTAIANATNTLFSGAAAADFLPVIFSKVRGKAYGIESIQVDDVPDVMRSRRLNEAVNKIKLP